MSTSNMKGYEGWQFNFRRVLSLFVLFGKLGILKIYISWKDSEPQKYVISIALLSRNSACFT